MLNVSHNLSTSCLAFVGGVGWQELVILALGFFVVVGLLLLYLLPAIIAFRKRHPNRWVIFLLNLLLGGTVIIWVVVLIWALTMPATGYAPSDTGAPR